MTHESRLLIGWREWVSLPQLRLPAIKAKVDTGARTSSLHAFGVEAFAREGRRWVRFHVHPLQERQDIIVTCEAPVADYRAVSDSGGHIEKRYVIETLIRIGNLYFPIEITLANRETMSHRMLIGRSAMKHLMIDPNHTYMLGVPSRVLSSYGIKTRIVRKKKKKKTKKKSSRPSP